MDAKLLNPAVLAFVGDGVYGLLVREKLADTSRKSGDLHSLSVKLVNASSQSRAFDVIKDRLSEEEMAIFKRGRNLHTSNTPKHSTKREYHTATGLEALFGYLHINGQVDRKNELFSIIWENFQGEL